MDVRALRESACTLCRLRVSNAFGGKAGFNVDVIHFFPQGVLSAITLVWRVTRDRVARDGVWFETGLLLCPYSLVQGKVQYHVAGAEALKFGPELTLFPLSVVFPLPTVGPLS